MLRITVPVKTSIPPTLLFVPARVPINVILPAPVFSMVVVLLASELSKTMPCTPLVAPVVASPLIKILPFSALIVVPCIFTPSPLVPGALPVSEIAPLALVSIVLSIA